MTKKRIVTHSAGFHADDVFGVATLALLLGEENIEIIRSRDQVVIDSGDYVLDVGFVYDPAINRFDHHQEGGAGKRDNGVPYASFGLIWKKFGSSVCASDEVAAMVDVSLVQAIDEFDNGNVPQSPRSIARPYIIQDAIGAFDIATRDSGVQLESFLAAVAWSKIALQKEIEHTKETVDMYRRIDNAYQVAVNKNLVLISDEVGVYERWTISKFLTRYSEPLYAVFKNSEGNWSVVAVADHERTFDVRKPFPEQWGGKHGAGLSEVTGVLDAYFCHNARFLAVAKTKEGAVKLAEIALAS